MSHLIDSNIVVEILRNRLLVPPDPIIILSAPVLGEVFFGALRSSNPTAQLQHVEEYIKPYRILSCNEITARHYADIRLALEASGGRIPENDMWIAALAIQHNLILVTRDAHFARIAGLTVEVW